MNKDNLLPLQDFSLKESNVYFLSHAEGFGDVDTLLEIVVFPELGTVTVLFPNWFW